MRTRAIVLAVIVVACVGAILLFRAHRSTNRIVCDSFGMGEPTTQCFITEHEPFKVQANHNPAKDTTGYRFYVNEKMVSEVPATAAANGVVMFSSEGLSAGTYMLYIEAYGPGGSSRSGLTLDVKPKEK
jgi:hypothetical protein